MEINIYYDQYNNKTDQLKRYIQDNKVELSEKVLTSLESFLETNPENINYKLITFNFINTLQKNKKTFEIERTSIIIKSEEDLFTVINKQIQLMIESEEYEICSKFNNLKEKFKLYLKNTGLIQ